MSPNSSKIRKGQTVIGGPRGHWLGTATKRTAYGWRVKWITGELATKIGNVASGLKVAPDFLQ